jgi:tyrosine-protein phosphatase non-receptor type 4
MSSSAPLNPLDGLRNEYANLPGINMMEVRALPTDNQNNDRYGDIRPYNSSMPRYPTIPYINASRIPPHPSLDHQEFIACQAPLPHTFMPFWKMVATERCDQVVMLTKFFESRGGKVAVKAHCYWPMVDSVVTHADVRITGISCTELPFAVVRVFRVEDESQEVNKLVTHYQFMNWPDQNVPEHSDEFSQLIDTVGQCARDNPNNCIITHCSAGVGRAGTFITGYIRRFATTTPETANIVTHLRQFRMLMVQTVEQYLFVNSILPLPSSE